MSTHFAVTPAVRALVKANCDACSQAKERANCFCKTCYFKLPPDMRSALYRPAGNGYEQAYREALAYLAKN